MRKTTPIAFLSVRKATKEACALKKLLKFLFVPLRRNNSPAVVGVKHISSFNTALQEFFLPVKAGRRNSFKARGNKTKLLRPEKRIRMEFILGRLRNRNDSKCLFMDFVRIAGDNKFSFLEPNQTNRKGHPGK